MSGGKFEGCRKVQNRMMLSSNIQLGQVCAVDNVVGLRLRQVPVVLELHVRGKR